ncbi:hypothetical protein N0V86_001888 [Didymella sp. IMI 355093]|nr:hypothetical protein N0V86_001888 [Didymella sp. IMI 355093]
MSYTITEAEALGFRACKRCRPNVENEDPQDKVVAKAMGFIEEAARKGEAKNLRLHDLAKKVGLTPRYFHKIFKDKTGTTPREYTNIVAAQHSSLSPTSASEASPSQVENFDWDSFDISELGPYQFDSNPTLGDDFMAQAAQITAAGFGEASIEEVPIQPWAGSSESPDSGTEPTLSLEQLSTFNGLDIGLVDFGQCQTTKHVPMDPTFDSDLNMAMLLQNDLANADFTLDVGHDLGMSSVSSTPGFVS